MKSDNEHKNRNHHPFQVPDEYFDKLSNEIINRKNEVKTPNTWITTPVLRWSLLSLFSVFLIFLAVIFYNQPDSPNDYLAEVSNDDILLYLESQSITSDELIDEFGTDLLPDADAYLDEDIEINEELLDQYDYEINIELKQEI